MDKDRALVVLLNICSRVAADKGYLEHYEDVVNDNYVWSRYAGMLVNEYARVMVKGRKIELLVVEPSGVQCIVIVALDKRTGYHIFETHAKGFGSFELLVDIIESWNREVENE